LRAVGEMGANARDMIHGRESELDRL